MISLSGDVSLTDIDTKVMHILSSMYSVGLMDNTYKWGDISDNVTTDNHVVLAKEMAVDA